MPGLKKLPKTTNEMTRAEVLAAVRAIPLERDYVWDGQDADDRPATREELATAIDAVRARRGRPPLAEKRPTLNMRIDADVLAAFKATGPGWQTRINALLRRAVENGEEKG